MAEETNPDNQIEIWEEQPIEIVLSRARREAALIDDLALDEEFRRTPSDIAYWNERYSQALKQYLLAKQHKETTWARLWLEIREEEADAKHKTVVDDMKAMVQVREEYQEAEIAMIEAEAEKESIKRFCDAIGAKKDMLQSLGAKLRVEMEGDPAIRSLHRDASRFGK